MSARADPGDSHPVRVYAVVVCMRVHEPDRSLNLFHNLGDFEPGLSAMDDFEDLKPASAKTFSMSGS